METAEKQILSINSSRITKEIRGIQDIISKAQEGSFAVKISKRCCFSSRLKRLTFEKNVDTLIIKL